MDRGERIEMMVHIYESLDSARNHEVMINTERQQELQHTGSVSVKNRRHRAVQVCLWLSCVLLLTAVIVLCVYFTTDRKHLLTHNYNLTKEREKILTEYTEILNQNRNLTEEREQIKNKTDELQDDLTHNHNLTKEREKLLIENNETLNQNRNLTEEREQIKNKTDELQDDLTHNHILTKEREKLLIENNETLNQNRNLTEEREQIKNKTDELQDDLTHNNNLTKEREKILIEYTEILNQNRNLTEERKQIKNKNDELQDDLTHNYNLTEEREKLPNDVKELNTWMAEDLNSNNSDKWINYNFSIYYISSEGKSWSDSREDCKQRRADLVIINSKEEQEFIQNATAGYGFDPFWIGLRREEGLWKWSDETTLTTSFWINGYPRSYNHYCARTSSVGWSDFSCDDIICGWICEKRI